MFDLASFDTPDEELTLDGDDDVVKDVDAGGKVVVWDGSTELLDGVAGDAVNGPPPCTRIGCAAMVGRMSGVTSEPESPVQAAIPLLIPHWIFKVAGSCAS